MTLPSAGSALRSYTYLCETVMLKSGSAAQLYETPPHHWSRRLCNPCVCIDDTACRRIEGWSAAGGRCSPRMTQLPRAEHPGPLSALPSQHRTLDRSACAACVPYWAIAVRKLVLTPDLKHAHPMTCKIGAPKAWSASRAASSLAEIRKSALSPSTYGCSRAFNLFASSRTRSCTCTRKSTSVPAHVLRGGMTQDKQRCGEGAKCTDNVKREGLQTGVVD